MLDAWNNLALSLGDFAFGWLLARSPNATLLVVAIGTSLILTGIRAFTTNQDLLRRVAADKRRQKALLREAKARGDKAAVARHRATLSQLAMKALRAEGRPLLASLIPVGLLATWCFQRLEFLPPQPTEPVQVVAYTPVSTIGDVLHLVPQDGLQAEAWVRRVEEDRDGERVVNGVATWIVRGLQPQTFSLLVRTKDRTLRHELRVGDRVYSPALSVHDETGSWVTELKMQPLRLFGVVPELRRETLPSWLQNVPVLNAIVMPAWLVAYLLIAIACVFVFKPLFRVF